MAQTSNYSAQDEMVEFFKNRKDILDATMKKKENDSDIKDEIEKQLREQAKVLSDLIKNKNKNEI